LPGNNKFKVLVACEVKAPLKLDPTPKVILLLVPRLRVHLATSRLKLLQR
jgi:hypothetical protein